MKSYYNTYAYVRDNELLDVAQHLIEGLETFRSFTLPCNSSLLNTWPLPSLLMAGVWAPTLRSCPVASGVDVAESLQASSSMNSETCSLASAFSINSLSSGIGQVVALDEDEALRIILAKHSEQSPSSPAKQIEEQKPVRDVQEVESDQNAALPAESNLGNSLNKKSGWSFDENQINTSDESGIAESSCEQNVETVRSPQPDPSFNALIESYNMLSGPYIKTPDLREVWQQLDKEDHVPKDDQIQQARKILCVLLRLIQLYIF